MKSLDPNTLSIASDSTLAIAARADNLDAFEALVRRYHHPLICFLQYYCRDLHTAEDVAQDAFLNCFRHIQSFDSNRPFKPWLYTIARNCLPKRVAATTNHSILPLLVADTNADPAGRSQIIEQRQSLWQVVRQHTSDDEFHLIWHRYADCLSIAEIAACRNESTDACKMRLSRLRRRLRPHLEPFLNDFVASSSLPLTPNRAA